MYYFQHLQQVYSHSQREYIVNGMYLATLFGIVRSHFLIRKTIQVKKLYTFLLFIISFSLLLPFSSSAQNEAASGEVFFNYGSTTGGVSQYYYSSFTVGQPVVGPYFGADYQGALGFWSRFLVAPAPPILSASEGDYPDRILLQWGVDPLSPASDLGFKIYRDGAFLASLDPSTLEFIDFNVIPGNFYNYEVRGVNIFGDGYPAQVVGFVNPNGSVTGQITSINGNPVADVQVTLEPTIGNSLNFDGVDDEVVLPHHTLYTDAINTISFWTKIGSGNDSDMILDLGKNVSQNWWVSTTANGSGKGIKIGIGGAEFPVVFSENPDDWHYVAFTYNSSDLNVYLDGELQGSIPATMTKGVQDLLIGKGNDIADSNFNGFFDDFRIYNRQLSQTEIIRTMNATVPSNAEGLVAYWKLDEGIGSKIFDLAENQLDGKITGATFSNDRPDVLNAGVTDASGYYLIDGINYGGGQNFTARPSKNFEFNNGLEFNATNSQYASISAFMPSDTGTVEVWFKPSSLTANQTILSNSSFDLSLIGSDLQVRWNGGSAQSITTISNTDYQHLSLTYLPNGGSTDINVYVNGVSTSSFSGSTVLWDNTNWWIGRNAESANYYTGLIDEVVFYNSVRTIQEIQFNAAVLSDGVNITDLNLLAFFSLNESVGTTFQDQSPNNTGNGNIYNGASWTSVTARPETVPHEFSPISRIVTLNPSSTGVDNVNFEDISTVSVSGYVRYANTQCFAAGTEILVDGHTHLPPIYTDEDGYFVADFEPGASFTLSPRFEEHQFIPAFWDISNIIVPKAGVVFNDQTTRNIEGVIAGGLCQKTIIPEGGTVIISLESTDAEKCFTRTLEISDPTGEFDFKKIPPIDFEVTIVSHPVASIDSFFTDLGGFIVDLSEKDTAIEFIYRSPVQIQLSDMALNCKGDNMLEQFEEYDLEVTVYEDYFGAICKLDSIQIQIDNDIAIGADIDSIYKANKYIHTFYAGPPNILEPYRNPITVTAIDKLTNRSATVSAEAVITGKRERVADFTSASPELPLMILRDPPGDQSYAYLEEGDQVCNSFSVSLQLDAEASIKSKVSLGPEYTAGTPFFSTEYDWDVNLSSGYTVSGSFNTETEQEVCITATSTIQTQSDETYPGSAMGGDLYVGGAINFIYGGTDVLSFVDSICDYTLTEEVFVRPDGFATNYVYSEAHIRDVLIPELIDLDSLKSAEMWQQVIDKNNDTKTNAVFHENRSFDAGVIYEYETEIEKTESTELEFDVSIVKEVAAEIGFKTGGIGAGVETSFKVGFTYGGSEETTNTSTTTVGYHLEDNDVGDNFSINILKDKVFGTPVFNTVAGQSSCPHEPVTQHRDEVSIQMAQTTQVNVPETEAAVFDVTVGNINPAEHRRVYMLGVDQASNESGAVIKINGQSANSPILFDLEYLESRQVTVTVEKGPVEYDYENLRLIFYSDCERERALDIGIDTDSLFLQDVTFNAYFIESCSNVNIGSPGPNWVVVPEDGDTMNITLNAYDLEDTDLELLRLQYRKVGGNGAWINIAEIIKDSLGPLFEMVPWDMSALSDGAFEIRALSSCSGGLPSGYSDVVTGRLEREPPQLLGTPSPSDGVLHAADQIYIEFTEDINCNGLTSLPGALENFVGLYFAQTNEPININISCTENRIYLDPVIANTEIENQILRAEVRGISDLVGNMTPEPITWEFFVDRNPLKWVESDIVDIKYDDESWSVTRSIKNFGGQTEAFTLENIPDWLTPSATSGEIAPGGTAFIVFTVPDQISNGQYQETIQLHNNMGDEPLGIDLAVLCRPEEWTINPSAFDYNMTFTVELNIEGELSNDPFDRVGAFVGDDLRGFANVEYVPSIGEYMAFLTVYSNQVEGEELSFRIWDASDCLLYGSVLENYTFINDGLEGTPDNPDVLHTQNVILKKIPVHNGWNWISFNLNMPDKDINVVLESLDHPQDVLIKDQVSFSQYFNAIGEWAGSLQDLGYTSMYQYKGTQNDTITLLGYPIDPDTVDIPINIGWNWIGYLPQNGASVDTALGSLSPLNGDIVKNQTSFAQYVTGVGWIGSLTYMEAPNGYLLKSSTEGVLFQSEPEKSLFVNRPEEQLAGTRSSTWDINPSDFEHSMTLIGVVEASGESMLKEGDEVAAFVDDEVRGTTSSLYIEALDIHLLFLTIYSNEGDETLSFKFADAETGEIYDLVETINFEINGSVGMVDEPQVLSFDPPTAVDNLSDDISLKVIPNPFRGSTNISLVLAKDDLVTIRLTDIVGNQVRELKINVPAGRAWIELDATSDNGSPLPTGVYFVNIEGEFGNATEKILLVD